MTTGLEDRSCSTGSRTLISRTTLLILALVLLGMGLGGKMPPEVASICLLFGCFGVASYTMLELVTRYRFAQQYDAARNRIEKAVSRRLSLLCERHSSAKGTVEQTP